MSLFDCRVEGREEGRGVEFMQGEGKKHRKPYTATLNYPHIKGVVVGFADAWQETCLKPPSCSESA